VGRCVLINAGWYNSSHPRSRILRNALEYIDAFWAEDFSFVALAAHAGASLRTVQTAFRRELGTTITGYVRQGRLAAARALLLNRTDASRVSAVAEQVGYFHLGRFSAEYHAAFGERSSDTLRRRR
jgi:transcriptional regulator GlxA family with amidase domain